MQEGSDWLTWGPTTPGGPGGPVLPWKPCFEKKKKNTWCLAVRHVKAYNPSILLDCLSSVKTYHQLGRMEKTEDNKRKKSSRHIPGDGIYLSINSQSHNWKKDQQTLSSRAVFSMGSGNEPFLRGWSGPQLGEVGTTLLFQQSRCDLSALRIWPYYIYKHFSHSWNRWDWRR